MLLKGLKVPTIVIQCGEVTKVKHSRIKTKYFIRRVSQ